MTIEKLKPSGDYLITDIIKGKYIKQRYSGYNKKESLRLFREHCKSSQNNKGLIDHMVIYRSKDGWQKHTFTY